MSASMPKGVYELPPRENEGESNLGACEPSRSATSRQDAACAAEPTVEPAEGVGGNAQPKRLPETADGAEGVPEPGSDETAISSALEDALARRNQEKREHTGSIVVAGCVIALAALTVLGSILNVGDHLIAAHPVLGGVFYALIAGLVAVGVVVPVVKVMQRPIFSLYQLRDEKGRAKRRRCQMLADNLIANTPVSDEEIEELHEILKQGDKTDDLLIAFFERHCVPAIDAETKRAASTAFFISAISRSPLISTVTMLSVCLDLVRSIVSTCGFRPTNLGLARLYARVMLSALIIGGIEDSDLSDLLGQLMGGGAGARAGGIVLGATAEGLVSAFLVFRVGVLTKKWLTAADGPANMQAIRRTSYREALAMMRTDGFMQVVADTVKQTTGAVATGVASTVKQTTETVATNIAGSVSSAARSTVEAARSAITSAFTK